MKSNLLNTATPNLAEVLSNGKRYHVPPYQRDYSWEEEQWEDLWSDMQEVAGNEQAHYMGAIVLQTEDRRLFKVIDGQQRLATMSIVLLAGIHQLQKLVDIDQEAAANQDRINILRNQFIGAKDAGSLTYSSKLFLNENNDAFYQNNLVQLRPPVNVRKLGSSNRLLWRAFQYFDSQLTKKFAGRENGRTISDFLTEVVADRLVFIQIVVDDDLSAYTVFETLNSRGVGLTATDLLKNYLFSQVSTSPDDLTRVRSQWKSVVDIIGLATFPTFLRHYISSVDAVVTKDKLFGSCSLIGERYPSALN